MRTSRYLTAVLCALLTASLVTSVAKTSQEKQGNGYQETSVQPFMGLQSKLKADGWLQQTPLLQCPEQDVVATLKDGKRARDLRKAVLRRSWAVVVPPIDLPAKTPEKYSLRIIYSKAAPRMFEQRGGKIIRLDASEKPAKIIFTTEDRATTTIRSKPKPDAQKTVWLQEMVELEEAGKVTARWYLDETAQVVFAKEKHSAKE